jgi:hypothetical protein
MFVPLGSLSTPGAEKFMFQSCFFCNRTGAADTGPFKINTEETPAVEAVKPFVSAHCTGIMVEAYRADACITVFCHQL